MENYCKMVISVTWIINHIYFETANVSVKISANYYKVISSKALRIML